MKRVAVRGSILLACICLPALAIAATPAAILKGTKAQSGLLPVHVDAKEGKIYLSLPAPDARGPFRPLPLCNRAQNRARIGADRARSLAERRLRDPRLPPPRQEDRGRDRESPLSRDQRPGTRAGRGAGIVRRLDGLDGRYRGGDGGRAAAGRPVHLPHPRRDRHRPGAEARAARKGSRCRTTSVSPIPGRSRCSPKISRWKRARPTSRPSPVRK